ncbi:TetR/AcrR family transcriptional regulator [Actinoplanes couchii]|uniref:TetR family transcriptional regulator n=1 Tax=Actinoplanes couchii TaxID=403638 RepID=A0ABQ3X7H7_9ACTN|nr:TetR/AcrR family transcriptional regulator [Actinoplanes couchii]MDR6322265.1 AcrR family transcriptional regulator [Actinoplanes couchii]GID54424.1 TetR family transcriptional regulator [Actinoplanes couchii]
MPRPLRADAARNRELLLQAAREVFARRGLDVTLDEIARHAGVGVGTAYRRFANKEALVEALFEDQLDRMVHFATSSLHRVDTWDGFVGMVTAFSEQMAADRGLREVVFRNYGRDDRMAQIRERFVPAMEAVVRRAQDAGVLRPDAAPTDLPIIEMMLGVVDVFAEPVRSGLYPRYLTLILDGLRARPGLTPLPVPALTHDEFDRLTLIPPPPGL